MKNKGHRAPVDVNCLAKMYEASEAKKTTAAATSYGWPGRFIGVSAPKLSTSFGENVAAINGVQVGPGATAFTRMPRSTIALDNARVNVSAPFVHE